MAHQTYEEFVAEHLMKPRFWLGEFQQAHQIGEYGFVEYRPWDRIDSAMPRTLLDTCHYLIFVGGKDIGRIADSLDMAFIVAVAYKHDGQNSHAATYFARMVGMITDWSK